MARLRPHQAEPKAEVVEEPPFDPGMVEVVGRLSRVGHQLKEGSKNTEEDNRPNVLLVLNVLFTTLLLLPITVAVTVRVGYWTFVLLLPP